MLCHLAQMKYLFPEALHIEKILTHDQASICMKPDIKVSLILDAAKDIDDSLQASYVDLCKAFHARILDFLNTHPEVQSLYPPVHSYFLTILSVTSFIPSSFFFLFSVGC